MGGEAGRDLGLGQAGFSREDAIEIGRDLSFHVAGGLADFRLALGGGGDFGPKLAVFAGSVDVEPGLHQAAQALHRGGRLQDGQEFALHLGQILGDERLNDGVFRRKIAVEIADAHPGGAGEILHRCAVKAFFGKGPAHERKDFDGAAVMSGLGAQGQLGGGHGGESAD